MSKRWLAPWRDSREKPAIYHCVSRVVDRRFVFGDIEREQFRMIMRMMENFTGCRVLSYCIMSNHSHILLEVPPMPDGGISDEELLKRLRSLYSEGLVDGVAKELTYARQKGRADLVTAIHGRYTYRMHDLSEFMRTLMQRMTRWYNRHDMGTDKLSRFFLPCDMRRVEWGHETFSLAGSLEGFVGETCDLPLCIARGGSEVCVW